MIAIEVKKDIYVEIFMKEKNKEETRQHFALS
jgi:hypothetical protein